MLDIGCEILDVRRLQALNCSVYIEEVRQLNTEFKQANYGQTFIQLILMRWGFVLKKCQIRCIVEFIGYI